MSWCGGGEISDIPGVEQRVLATLWVTFAPGRCPPSPGLAPWAILICISFAESRYSRVTPKRPEATCLMAEFNSVPKRSGSSPPSPLLLLPPSRFMAAAMHSWASFDMEP